MGKDKKGGIMKKTTLTLFLIFIISFFSSIFSCTIGVASGKATSDGRPLLWKNRDSSGRENYAMFFKGKIYDYIGVFSRERSDEIYGGVNEKGFAIINSVAYDFPNKGWDNGEFMKKALEECRTIKDFENLLIKGKGKYNLSANLGVIDSYGGAAIFEAWKDGYKKFDANDSENGYILRTNFSFTGGGDTGKDRFLREKELFKKELNGKINLSFILRVFRDITGKDGKFFNFKKGYVEGDKRFFYTKNAICRPYTVSSIVIKGVKINEPSYLTTMFFITGNPLTGPAIPLWVKSGSVPEILSSRSFSPLNKLMLKIYNFIYPDEAPYTLDVALFKNKGAKNFLKKIIEFENKLIEDVNKNLESWRINPPSEKTLRLYQNYVADQTYRMLLSFYKKLYYNKSLQYIKTIKLKYPVLSNPENEKDGILSLSSRGKLLLLNSNNLKLRRIKIRGLNYKYSKALISRAGSNIYYVLTDNNLLNKIKITKNKAELLQSYNLKHFKGYKTINNLFPSFIIYSNYTILAAYPELNSIFEINFLKNQIKKTSGKLKTPGFRDGGLLHSLLSFPFSAFKTEERGIIFTDKDNDSIRYLNDLGTLITLYGEPQKGIRKETFSDNFYFKKPTYITKAYNGSFFFISDGELFFLDEDNFVKRLIKTEESTLPIFKSSKLFLLNIRDKKIAVFNWRIK